MSMNDGGETVNNQSSTLWVMQMALATQQCQQAVETLHDTASRNEMLDSHDLRLLSDHLSEVCNLLGLSDNFILASTEGEE